MARCDSMLTCVMFVSRVVISTATQCIRYLSALLQVSLVGILPIVAVVTSILAVIVILTASYLVMNRPVSNDHRTSTMRNAISDTPTERWQLFSSADFKSFFERFLLPDEISVLNAMAKFLIADGVDFSKDQDHRDELGWRNKYAIVKESKVSQRRVYSKGGIIDRMESLGIVERKNSDSSWGGMKHLYRLRIDSEFVKAYIVVLQPDLECP